MTILRLVDYVHKMSNYFTVNLTVWENGTESPAPLGHKIVLDTLGLDLFR